MKGLAELYEIQCLDRRKCELKERKASLPVGEEVESLRRRVQDLKETLDTKRVKLADLDRAIHKKENDCGDLDFKHKEVEATLYGGRVTNPKELDSLGQKLKSMEQKKDKIEEELLEHIIDRDDLLESIAALEAELATEGSKLEAIEDDIKQEIAEIGVELSEIPQKRSALEAQVDDKLLARYERLYDKLDGEVIALVKNGSCGYCRLSISEAVLERMHNELVTCENCGRILLNKDG